MTPLQTIIPPSSTPPHTAALSARLVEVGSYQGACQDHYLAEVLQTMLEIRKQS